MDINGVGGHIHEQQAGALLLFLAEGAALDSAVQAVDEALGGAIAELIAAGDFTGEKERVAVLYARGGLPAARVILVGLGAPADFTVEALRRAAAVGLQEARRLKVEHVASAPPALLDAATGAHALVEGGLLGLYHYHGQRTSAAPDDLPDRIDLIVADDSGRSAIAAGIAAGRAYAEGAIVARNLVNLPPNICTPAYLAERATAMAKEVGLRAEVLEKRQMAALKMGALLAVAQGSDTPPRFIILEHNAGKAAEHPTIVLVGKGVTFDTGGYSLKSRDQMLGMKADMSGAAAVIGAMKTIALLDLPLHVVGLAPAADNMVSGGAYRPQEVITAGNGTTIEVISTDAEGRLLLADALVYAARYQPAAVVDIATLTGSVVVALGNAAAGLFSTDDRLRDALHRAGEEKSERLWPLPLFDEYEKAIESDTADIKNSGGRTGGVGTSAVFLRHFVDYPAWAHVDIAGMAGMADGDSGSPYVPKGATGFGARLLAAFVAAWARG